MLVGFEMLTIQYSSKLFVVSLVFILVVLLARFISVSIPVVLLKRVVRITKTEVAILSWGGLRGGLSIALALSLAPDMHRETFVFITFVVVVFSIIVQGLTIEGFYKRLVSQEQKRKATL
jgi:CPA1 family monovalent cation:H+ antiporter